MNPSHIDISNEDLEYFAYVLKQRTGILLGESKRTMVESRLIKRFSKLQIHRSADYRRILAADSDELQEFINLLTTNLTNFYREPKQIHFMSQTVVPNFLKTYDDKPFMVWSAASSTGEEPYTIALALAKIRMSNLSFNFRVLASDIDTQVLQVAEEGIYDTDKVHGVVPVDLMHKYFLRGKGSYQNSYKISDELKAYIKFRRFNLITDDWPVRFQADMIFIRNVLIYFDPETVRSVVHKLVNYLKPGGYLCLGVSESIQGTHPKLEIVGEATYQKKGGVLYGDKSTDLVKSRGLASQKVPAPEVSLNRRIRILIVDDSAPMRKLLRKVAEEDLSIEVVGEAEDAVKAEKLRLEHKPDVITLDLHMPLKDGVDYLSEYMAKDPVPTLVVSDYHAKGSAAVFRALEYGAFDYIQKPSITDLQEFGRDMRAKITAAYKNRKSNLLQILQKAGNIGSSTNLNTLCLERSILAIGSSTGGTEVLKVILKNLPNQFPPLLIVQHMAVEFTKEFAKLLATTTGRMVKEAEQGEVLRPQTNYLAPGGRQMGVKSEGTMVKIEISDEGPINKCRPSIDYLFHSLRSVKDRKIVAALLTGMGSDGARGLADLKSCGAYTLVQDQETSAVYEIPKMAVEMGAATEVVPVSEMAARLCFGLSAG